jgi:hypothetical protein
MITYPITIAEKKAYWAAKKAELDATPVLMSSEETPASIRKARVQAKLAELDAARSNPPA